MFISIKNPCDKSGGKRKRKAHIKYDLFGCIPADKPIKAEQA